LAPAYAWGPADYDGGDGGDWTPAAYAEPEYADWSPDEAGSPGYEYADYSPGACQARRYVWDADLGAYVTQTYSRC
jgi:hypothetical protein